MEKIVDIIESIAHEKGLTPDVVTKAIKNALERTAQKMINENFTFEAEIDNYEKRTHIYQIITVVADNDERLFAQYKDPNIIALSDAVALDPDVEIDDQLRYEHDFEKMGRTGASVLFREIEFHVQRLVEDQLYAKYQDMVGQLITGRVTRIDHEENTYIEIDEIRAVLPRKNRIKGEKFKSGDVVSSVLRKINISKNDGMVLEVSRTTPKFLEALLELEVPEIKDNLVSIERSARIPGERAKIALLSLHPRVDAVGSTVGVKGVRINAVSAELMGENIDCIEYTQVPEIFIARAMSPAIITTVAIEGNKAIVTLPADQKSKAIGKSGINIRLASMLTGYEIELKEIGGSTMSTSERVEEKRESVDSLEALFNM
ncbi:MAG: transcription elongation factor NusA [Sulfurovum sp. PC08-66]|nr:MAG: transcription elongation factor NusA [Sulfurovum sp. PC08-66]KIM12630.1 MAG: transcription elongation factor NusA [Sulfuricurvum sp. PC08-66]